MSHPLNMVTLRLDVESMRHSVVHALVDHQGDIQKQVEAEVSELVTNGYLEHKIKESVRRHLDAAISDAVKHAMSSWTRESPTVKQAIQSAVMDALWQTEREPWVNPCTSSSMGLTGASDSRPSPGKPSRSLVSARPTVPRPSSTRSGCSRSRTRMGLARPTASG